MNNFVICAVEVSLESSVFLLVNCFRFSPGEVFLRQIDIIIPWSIALLRTQLKNK